ncbi:MAG: hypothetical protein A3I68_07980 [Candidatus Melainabacteria bacterium RIFCSPLOWO2_02_FULL_35_15]|nr:MAG: hypothetical protein A3F80_02550 [Candidatus Melainabacteria bacterium RIFCSPLOWO2_12_FULL_35_11]OGI14226.1 MAG: hypothetical protein A3I68_07980 [Candidatus Melainabacteria bacterium RIFCSPLOWO2_02_FULL_35_15]
MFLFLTILNFHLNSSTQAAQNEIIAKINNEDIFQSDFNRLLNAQKKKLIEKLVNETLLLQEAKAKNISISEEDITKRLNQIKEKQGGEQAFNKFLTENNATVEDAKNEIKNQILIRLVKNQINDLSNFLTMKKLSSDIIIYTNKIFPTTACLQSIPSDPIKMEESISKALAEEIQKDESTFSDIQNRTDNPSKVLQELRRKIEQRRITNR